jgi:dihydrofolate synthase/folylpolyglutamate synthase
MSLHPRSSTLGLERIERLLAALGIAEAKLPPVIHVAGTNGKGSAGRLSARHAEAAGYRVHVYTSPHLVRFNERIRLAGRLIDDHESARRDADRMRGGQRRHADHLLRDHHGGGVPGLLARPGRSRHLEVGWAAGFDSHQRDRARPATAITPVGYDHTGFLGDKLEGIAFEKAGILKRATPAVIGRQREVSAQVIETEAAKLAAPLFRMGREWQVMPKARLPLRKRSPHARPAQPGADGRPSDRQCRDCRGLHLERLRAARFEIDDTAIAKGLGSVEWPARLQRLTKGPLPDSLPPGCELWLDGGHNEDCGIVLGRMAAEWAKEPAALPLYLVFAMQTTKDASGFLRPLARHATAARAVPFPEGHAAYTPQEACAKAADVGLDCAPANDIGAALEDLLATQPAPMRILICGSLYLAGEVLVRNG